MLDSLIKTVAKVCCAHPKRSTQNKFEIAKVRYDTNIFHFVGALGRPSRHSSPQRSGAVASLTQSAPKQATRHFIYFTCGVVLQY